MNHTTDTQKGSAKLDTCNMKEGSQNTGAGEYEMDTHVKKEGAADVDVEQASSVSGTSTAAFRAIVGRYSFSPVKQASGPPHLSLGLVPRRSPRNAKVIRPNVHNTGETKVERSSNLSDDSPFPNAARKRKRSKDAKGALSSSPGIASKSPSPSKSPSKRVKRSYAPPEVYAHLHPLSDNVKEGLDVMFCGINPGEMSAQRGHHFARPNNHFWRCLYQSGLTPHQLSPNEDYTLPDKFNLGLTNLVARPSAEAAELSKAEMQESVPTFLEKVAHLRPRFICFIGLGIWEVVRSVLLKMVASESAGEASLIPTPAKVEKGQTTKTKVKGPKISRAKAGPGLQPFKLVSGIGDDNTADEVTEEDTLIFVVPSTSGRVTSYQLPDKVAFFSELRVLVGKEPFEFDTSGMTSVRLSVGS